MKINKYNIESLPGLNGNAYSGSRRLYDAIKVDYSKAIDYYNPLDEGLDWEVDDKEKGGVIVLSTDVNAVDVDENKFLNFIKKKLMTLDNRVTYNKKIDRIANKHNLIGWTVGKFLSGRYKTKKGVNFGENSLSVEIVGIDSYKLLSIAEDLCRTFTQETVLVKDYTTGKIFFVNRD